jgi:hypothetical protein
MSANIFIIVLCGAINYNKTMHGEISEMVNEPTVPDKCTLCSV